MATTVDRDTHGCLRIISDDWGTMIVPEAQRSKVWSARAFVKLDERSAMLYVELGAAAGERRERHEIVAVREIDRDEFDRLNGIDALRRELGWDLAA